MRMAGLRYTYTHSGEVSKPIPKSERWQPSRNAALGAVGFGG
jgi:hypothetical protein